MPTAADPAFAKDMPSPDRSPHKLSGVRVLDLTSVMAGPYASALLGDLGADVIKVEPAAGDITRRIGAARHEGMAGVYLTLNRNKRSVVIDLTRDEGRSLLLDLARSSDVFLTSMRPDALEKLRLRYDDLSQVSPRLLYCALSGYGRHHPEAGRPAYDDVIQAGAGLVDLQRLHTDLVRYVPLAFADFATGLMATIAVLAALAKRGPDGPGEEIEVSLFETAASLVLTNHLAGAAFVPPLGPPVYSRIVAPSRKPFRARDGYLSVLPYNDEDWRNFFTLIARPALASDERFSTMAARTEHIVELYTIVEEAMQWQDAADWLTQLRRLRIPCAVVSSTTDLVESEALHESGVLNRVVHPSEGDVLVVRNPVRYADQTPDPGRPAPELGADTFAVLGEIGYPQARIRELTASRVIAGR
jgi:crotonobetainyl-CoA:carnitine CoA-transferase CaiB-like acyl-CoA transferase